VLFAIGLVGGAFTLVALLLSPAAGLSVGLGAITATLNMWALARIVGALFPRGPTGAAGAPAEGRGAWSLVALLKMLALFAVVGLLIRHGVVSPVPMMLGFGSLPIGIVIGSQLSDRSARGRED
jgi:hypothetical protein